MLAHLLHRLRERWHPLWRLRQWSAFRLLQRTCDPTIYRRLPGTGIRVAIKLLRDASWATMPAGLEPQVQRAFSLVLEHLQPRTFWDIGANIGYYSWFVRQHPAVEQVMLFEPDPVNGELLKKTIRKNSLKDCRVFPVAVADCTGEGAFLIDRASGATGALAQLSTLQTEESLHRAYRLGETIPCRTTTIDQLIAEGVPPPSFLKIDVEGAEHLVVVGGEASLKTHRPALIMETRQKEVVQQLQAWGYAAFQVDEGNLLFVAEVAGTDFSPFTAVFQRL